MRRLLGLEEGAVHGSCKNRETVVNIYRCETLFQDRFATLRGTQVRLERPKAGEQNSKQTGSPARRRMCFSPPSALPPARAVVCGRAAAPRAANRNSRRDAVRDELLDSFAGERAFHGSFPSRPKRSAGVGEPAGLLERKVLDQADDEACIKAIPCSSGVYRFDGEGRDIALLILRETGSAVSAAFEGDHFRAQLEQGAAGFLWAADGG